MKNYLIFILLFCNTLFAQYDTDVFGNQTMTNTSGLWIVNSGSNKEIKGNYLLFEKSNNNGIITTKEGRRFKVPNLNYNVKDDQIQAKISNDSVFIFDPAKIDIVEINGKLLKRYLNIEPFRNCYFEIVARSKDINLLKKYDVIIKEGSMNPLTQQKQSSDIYVIKSKYFIHSQENLSEIALKKGKLLKIFKEDSDKITKYIDDNDLSVKNEGDLKEIFNYHNSLL